MKLAKEKDFLNNDNKNLLFLYAKLIYCMYKYTTHVHIV